MAVRGGSDEDGHPHDLLTAVEDAVLAGHAHEALALVASVDGVRLPPDVADRLALAAARAHEQLGQLDRCLEVLRPLHERALRGRAGVSPCVTGILLCRALMETADLTAAAEAGAAAMAAAGGLGLEGSTDHLRLAATVAIVHHERGDLAHAMTVLTRHLQLADAVGDEAGLGSLHWNAAVVCEALGRYDEAVEHGRRAVALLVDPRYARDVAFLGVGIAGVLVSVDPPRLAEAEEMLERSWPRLAQIASGVDRAYWYDAASRAALLRGDADAAAEHARAALVELGPDLRLERSMARIALGDALLAQRADAAAADEYRLAADQLQMESASRQSAEVWRELGERLARAGDPEGAVDAMARSLDSVGLRATGGSLRPW